MQSLAEYYSEAGFLKTYGNVSEAAKYLFKERLKARVTPTFYMFRNGEHHLHFSGCMHRQYSTMALHLKLNIPEHGNEKQAEPWLWCIDLHAYFAT